MEEILIMSNKEIDRYVILERVRNKTLKQSQASQLMKITTRQVRNLLRRVKVEGKKGVISKKRGAPSNRQLESGLKEKIKGLIREKYPDFGPTLANEKLFEIHHLKVSTETIRAIMIEQQLWFAERDKKRIHQRREPRKCFGELIQGDASHHDWFEGRRAKCALTVLIDDATSRLTALHFSERETFDGYMTAIEEHLTQFGRPKSFYTDRHAIFKTTRKSGKVDYQDTRLKKVLNRLDVELILARSPQAKGRVERANKTLQNRLVKEMRLRGINTLEEANAFLPEYIEIYNKKFGREPSERQDVHRALLPNTDLKRTLCPISVREISKDLSFQYQNTIYQLKDHSRIGELRGKKVEIKRISPKAIEVWYKNEMLEFNTYNELPYSTNAPKISFKSRGSNRKYEGKTYRLWRKQSSFKYAA